MKRDIIIIGGGGWAVELAETLEQINKYLSNKNVSVSETTDVINTASYNLLGFVYDGAEESSRLYDFRVLGDFSYLKHVDMNTTTFICGVSVPEVKRELVKKVKEAGGKFETIVHPASYVSPRIRMGEGCIVQSNCILIGAGIVLGDFVSFNDSIAIGHASRIGSYSHINPNVNISGEAEIGDGVFIGVKATILKAKVGDWSVVGACSLITRDMPPNMMAKGVPAVYSEKTEKRYR